MTGVTEVILHCQKQLKKDLSDDKLMHYLRRLKRLRIKLKDLVETGIGRSVNQLSRHEGEVGSFAEQLVSEWKELVEAESGSASASPDSSPTHKSSSSAQRKQKHRRRSSSGAEEDEEEEDEDQDDDDDNNDDLHIKRELEELREAYCDDDEEDDEDDGLVINEAYASPERNNNHLHHPPVESSDEEEDVPTQKYTKVKVKEEPRSPPPVSSDSEPETDSPPPSPSPPPTPSPPAQEHRDRSRKDKIKIKQERLDSDDEEDRARQKHKRSSPDKHHKSHSHNHRSKEPETEPASSTEKHKDKSKTSTDDKDKHQKKIKKEPKSPSPSRYPEKDKKRKDKDKDSHRRHDHHKTDKDKNNDKASSSTDKKSKDDFDLDKKIKQEKVEVGKVKDKKEKDKEVKKEEKKKVEIRMMQGEIDSTSGLNFEAVLGCLDSVKSKAGTSSSRHGHTSGKAKSASPQKGDRDKIKKEKVDEYAENGARKRVAHGHGKMKDEPKPSSSSSSKSSKSASNGIKEKDSPSKSKIKIDIDTVLNPNYKPSIASRIMASSSSSSSKGNGKRRGSANADGLKKEILRSLDADEDDDQNVVSSTTSNGNGHPVSRHAIAAAAANAAYSSGGGSDSLATMIVSRKQKTKVYSGVKSGYYGQVPRLFDMSLRVIQENLDDLGYTGGVPYDILKPVLERASVSQLLQIEHYNPYLIESTGDLWAFHCKRDFRGEKRLELETWRELYSRCVEARETKFEQARKRVGENYENKPMQRKAKLAYVETSHGPRFSKSKAATIQNGMKTLKIREEGKGLKRSLDSDGSKPTASTSKHGQMKIEDASVIISSGSRAGSAPGSVSRDHSLTSGQPPNKKLKKAPLMQKTLKIIKSLSRR